MQARFQKYTLRFKNPSGTSRGVYTVRNTWFISLLDERHTGIGECAPLPDLSLEHTAQMDRQLERVCASIDHYLTFPEELVHWPSIRFGLETAILDLQHGGKRILYPSPFTQGEQGIPINGLIWMGSADFMKEQIRTKLELGFHCLKLKIGALDFETEYLLLKDLRKSFSPQQITLRVDANGAFGVDEAPEKLKRLADLQIHSIEQPIGAGQWEAMADLCAVSPLPIALDEELIVPFDRKRKTELIQTLKPHYLILKPSLHGGLSGCEEWIDLAEQHQIGWWITSALESNIGLNAIAQWTFSRRVAMAQGLGTGALYSNNFDSPLYLNGETLWHNPKGGWDLNGLQSEQHG